MQPGHPQRRQFTTTRWTIVLQTRGDDDTARRALSELCERYWFPLYSYARRWGRSVADSEDAVQEFFGVIMERDLFKSADPDKGKLRTYLLTSFKRHLRDRHQKETAVKRGGAARVVSIDTEVAEQRYAREPSDQHTAEQVFQRRWALSVLADARGRLEADYVKRMDRHVFAALAQVLDHPNIGPDYATLAATLGCQPAAARVAVSRLRQRFGNTLRQVIRDTVETDDAVDEELNYLQNVLRGDA